MLYGDRRRAESFGARAELYDRTRPTYPPELLDAVLGSRPGGLSVLDVGCGTGIAARLMSSRGAEVLGVEVDERMAALARRRGISVETSSFEAWEPAGRTFDRVVAAQAWHWVDPVAGAAKAASVLAPAGRLCPFWNMASMPAELDAALAGVYGRLAPGLDDHAVLLGGSRARPERRYEAAVDGMRECPSLSEPVVDRFRWTRSYSQEEWLEQLPTHSDHAALPPVALDRLLSEVADVIDRLGGSFEMLYTTVVISAAPV